MNGLKMLVLLGCVSLTSGPLFAGAVAAKKNGVKVLKEPGKDAETIMTLKKDESVESSERKGMFWKVKTAKGEGYVAFLDVTRKAEDDGSLSKAIRAAARDSRDMDDVKSGRARSAVMGVRGLDESGETSYAGSVKPNLRLVYNMEDQVVDQQKIDKIADLVQEEIAAKMK